MKDTIDIKKILPHRYPFLLIDKILEYEIHKHCKTLKNFSTNEYFFEGHFPQAPIVPGVLIIESLAQTAALLGGEIKKGNDLFMLVGADKFKFQSQVVPGDQMICEATVMKKKLNMFIVDAIAVVKKPNGEDKKCASGILKCAKVNMSL